MNALQTFQFHSHQLTAIADENGTPWFIAKEVAEILEYSDAFKMTVKLDDDEVQNRQIGGFGNRGVNLINESGLYSLILTSRKPEAKTFKKWVTSEALPAIRKTGNYISENSEASYAIKLLEAKDHLLASQQANIDYLRMQLDKEQSISKGMVNIYTEETEKVNRLMRAKGKCKLLERRDIFNLLDEGREVPEIAKWMFRSTDFVKAVIKAGRFAQ